MWTPRRIVLLLLGFLGSLSGYVAYGRSFLGAIDGLPGLPSEYLRVRRGPSSTHGQTKQSNRLRRSSSRRSGMSVPN